MSTSFGRSTTLVGGGGGGSVSGSGTVNKLAKFTAGTTLGDSIASDDGTDLTVAGRLRFSGTTHGGLVLNNLTTTQRDAIVSPLTGSLIWNSTTGRANIRTASAWTSGWVRLEGDTMTGALGITQGAITADAAALSITSTYNNAGVAFGGAIDVNVTDTASGATSLLARMRVGGVTRFSVRKDGVVSADSFAAGSGGGINISDVILSRDAAQTLAQRNSTNAQTFNIYNTFTSSTNHERGFLSWVSNEFRIGTEKGSGGGSARALGFYTDGAQRATISASGVFTSFGNIVASGANLQGSNFVLATSGRISPSADGVFNLLNNAQTDFGRLNFGLATNLFPALKRSSAMLECKLADDSGFAAFGAEWLSITDGVTAPTAVAGRARIYVDSADGDLKVVFADGTVKTIVTDT